MNILKQQVKTCTEINIKDSQALIEGSLRLPDGMEEISSVLAAEGIAEVKSTSAVDGIAIVSGTAKFNIVYLGKRGDVHAFDSECSFEHSAENTDIRSDMQVFADISVADTDFSLKDGLSIEIKSLMSVNIVALGNMETEIVSGITGCDGMELLMDSEDIPYLSSAKNTKSYVKSEIRIPQSLPPCDRVLIAKGTASVSEVHTEDEKIIVEGSISVFAAYLSMDKNAPIQFVTENIPVAEIVKEPFCSEGSDVSVSISVEDIVAECVEGGDLLKIHAVCAIHTFCYGSEKVIAIKDAYSADKAVETSPVELFGSGALTYEMQKKIIRVEHTLPQHEAELARGLFACAYPQITDVRQIGSISVVSGIICANICYSTPDAGIKSTKANIPFETELQTTGDISLSADYAVVSGSGRDIELKIGMDVLIAKRNNVTFSGVSDVEVSDMAPEKESGIIVFISSGETLWDVAKKFRVSRNRLLKLNEGICDGELPVGEKIVVVI